MNLLSIVSKNIIEFYFANEIVHGIQLITIIKIEKILMNSFESSAIYSYYLYQPFIPLNYFNYIPVYNNFVENPINPCDYQIADKSINYSTAIVEEQQKIEAKTKVIYKKDKNIAKRPFKPRMLDILEPKQRQQTVDRNLTSNTLKIYFKQLRESKTETHLNVAKIIEIHKMKMILSKFMKKLSLLFPSTATYISFDQVKKRLSTRFDVEQQASFNKILRISMSQFYRYEIFTVNIKSARTTRKIRNQQISHGKCLLNQLGL